ncbi:MAG: manganese efflux pump family protein [Gaiellaceae bacterium]|nr:manganese efflux pump family protein [Gaiellaceae bacterium]
MLPAAETALPLVGLALGAAAGSAIGHAGDYPAAAALLGVGAWLLVEDGEPERATRLARGGGLAVLALGLGVGLDELAIGFSAGLLDLPLVPALVVIAVQAVVAAQLGLRVGARLGKAAAARAETLAGAALVVAGLAVLVVRLAG